MLSPLRFGSVFVPKEYLVQAGLPSLADPAMMDATAKEIHENAKGDPLPLMYNGQARNEHWQIHTVALVGSTPNGEKALEAGRRAKDEYVGGVVLQTESPRWIEVTTTLRDVTEPQRRLRGISTADEALVRYLEGKGVPKDKLIVKHILPLNDDLYESAGQLAKQ